MIAVEHDISRWRTLYRRTYGHDPPASLERLKLFNRVSVDRHNGKIAPVKRKRGGRMPGSIDAREVWQILDAYDLGKETMQEIADRHGCDRRTVRQIARRAGRIGRVRVEA